MKKRKKSAKHVILQTLIWMQDNSYEKCQKAVDLALAELGTDYIDLLLLHQPMGDYYGAWRALEEAYEAGKVKAIGMANCYPQIIADMADPNGRIFFCMLQFRHEEEHE